MSLTLPSGWSASSLLSPLSFAFDRYRFAVHRRWIDNEFHVHLLRTRLLPKTNMLFADELLEHSVMASQALVGRSVVGGAIDALDVRFPCALTEASVSALLITEVVRGDVLMPAMFIAWATGLPIVANGGDVVVTWDNGPWRIFHPDLQEQ